MPVVAEVLKLVPLVQVVSDGCALADCFIGHCVAQRFAATYEGSGAEARFSAQKLAVKAYLSERRGGIGRITRPIIDWIFRNTQKDYCREAWWAKFAMEQDDQIECHADCRSETCCSSCPVFFEKMATQEVARPEPDSQTTKES